MIAPYIPTRSDFRIQQGSLGIALTVSGPPECGSVLVSDEKEAESAIETMIDDAREKVAHQIDLMKRGVVFF